jgi:O-antigen/teichoic acid export membrane protein
MKESTFRPAVLLMAGRAFASIATFLIPLTLVRVFDQDAYGTYKQLFLIFTSLYSIALVGLSDSLYYFVPNDPRRAGRYVANAALGLAVSGLVCVAGLTLGRHAIAAWMRNPALAEHIPATAVFLLFSLVATVFEITLVARKQYTKASTAYVVSDVARALCLVVPALFYTNLGALMAAAVAFSAARMLAALVLLRREFGADLAPDSHLVRAQVAYALPFAVYVLFEIVQASYHQYAVSLKFDAATFAIYSVGCFQVPLVDFLATPASSVMMVRMSEELRDGRPQEALAIWRDITRKLALVFFPLTILLMTVSREVMTFLFTDAYAASGPIFAVWVLSIALSIIQTDGVMRVHAQLRYLIGVNVLRLVLIAALTAPLIAAFGLVGPVVITILAIAVAKTLHLVRMKQLMNLSTADVLPWGALAAILATGLVAAAPTLAVGRMLVDEANLLRLCAVSVTFLVGFLALAFGTGLIREDERTTILRTLRFPSLRPAAAGASK